MYMRPASTVSLFSIGCVLFLMISSVAVNPQLMGGGVIRGRIWGYTYLDEAVPLVWANVKAYSGGREINSASTGTNGAYVMYLPVGYVNVTVEYPGFIVQSKIVSISEGGSMALDWYLERSGLPIPEFQSYGALTLMVILLTFCQLILRRRK